MLSRCANITHVVNLINTERWGCVWFVSIVADRIFIFFIFLHVALTFEFMHVTPPSGSGLEGELVLKSRHLQ